MGATYAAVPLGKLVKARVRDAWPNEERNFTRWLAAEGISLLSEELGTDLQIVGCEHTVGRYSLDILATETPDTEAGSAERNLVVIENQFGSTDHDHLGKLMTYAAGVGDDTQGAKTAIWIAENFTEEHQRALEWLNETSRGIRFYGVQLELYQIGESIHAPAFNIVVRPNEIVRARREAPSADTSSERNLFYVEYWTAFKTFCVSQSAHFNLQTPRPTYWTQAALGRTGVHLAFSAARRDGWIGCELALRGTAVTEVLPELLRQQTEINADLAGEAQWERVSDKFFKIYVSKKAVPAAKDDWENQHQWLLAEGEVFYAAFADRLRRF